MKPKGNGKGGRRGAIMWGEEVKQEGLMGLWKPNSFLIQNFLPLKRGQRAQALMPPVDMYCPIQTSRKNIGMPPKKTEMKYGMRKAPVDKMGEGGRD